jgi:hypothetical protein
MKDQKHVKARPGAALGSWRYPSHRLIQGGSRERNENGMSARKYQLIRSEWKSVVSTEGEMKLRLRVEKEALK